MRLILSGLSVLALAITTTNAAAQNRLSRECRQEIRSLCDGDRSAILACLRENYSELSETCQTQLRELIKTVAHPEPPAGTHLPPQKINLLTSGQRG